MLPIRKSSVKNQHGIIGGRVPDMNEKSDPSRPLIEEPWIKGDSIVYVKIPETERIMLAHLREDIKPREWLADIYELHQLAPNASLFLGKPVMVCKVTMDMVQGFIAQYVRNNE